MHVALLGPYGFGNLGDAAIQDAALHHLRERISDARPFGVSLNPADTRARHGIDAVSLYPTEPTEPGAADRTTSGQPGSTHGGARSLIRRVPWLHRILRGIRRALGWVRDRGRGVAFAARVYRTLRTTDLLVVSGGGQLDDYWGGAWRHPFSLFRWTALARLTRTRVVFLSVGTGSVRSSLSRFFFRRALGTAAYRSFRDARSRDAARAFGAGAGDAVVPDLAFSLPVTDVPTRQPRAVAVCPMPFLDSRAWPAHDDRAYEDYMDRLGDVVRRLQRRGYAVHVFGTNVRMDARAVGDLLARTRDAVSPGDPPERVDVESVADALRELARVELVIASRYHAVLLAYLNGTPAIGLSYDPKVNRLMDDAGQTDCCLEIGTFAPADVERLALAATTGDRPAAIADHVATCRHAVLRQYDEVFGRLAGEIAGSRRLPVGPAEART